MLVVRGVGWEGEQDACLAVLAGEGLLEGVEELAGEDYGLEELLLVLGADEFYVLLEAKLKFEVALSVKESVNASSDSSPSKEHVFDLHPSFSIPSCSPYTSPARP